VKKLVVILLLVFYASASIGATVNLHFCMNKLVGWSLIQSTKKEKCGKCGMVEKKGGCCKEEKKEIKVSDEHILSVIHLDNFDGVDCLVAPTSEYVIRRLCSTLAVQFPATNSPPGRTAVPVYILNCAYLI
jgi:hypothetical protein